MIYEDKVKGIFIKADEINIGENVNLGNNINVRAHGKFTIGSYSKLGDNTSIEGNNISIGDHFYGSGGMRVGAGGQEGPKANLTIGDRCVIHDNVLNIGEPVEIGNDVGFSGRVELITHGFWLSVLEGYPTRFEGIKINDGVILGHNSTVMMGVKIAKNICLGAHSLVTKDLSNPNSIYVGSPAKYVRKVTPLKNIERIKKLESIIDEYLTVAKYQNINPSVKLSYPFIIVNNFRVNVETFEYEG